ncbi:MAG: helix-turn-helix domain-containing protein [Candidatus Dormibacteria bacterium]
MRARIVLLAAAGEANSRIAAQLGCSVATVQLWRRRFAGAGSRDWSKMRRGGAVLGCITSAPWPKASASPWSDGRRARPSARRRRWRALPELAAVLA